MLDRYLFCGFNHRSLIGCQANRVVDVAITTTITIDIALLDRQGAGVGPSFAALQDAVLVLGFDRSGECVGERGVVNHDVGQILEADVTDLDSIRNDIASLIDDAVTIDATVRVSDQDGFLVEEGYRQGHHQGAEVEPLAIT